MPQPSDAELAESSKRVLKVAFDVVSASLNDLDSTHRPAFAMAIFAACKQVSDSMDQALKGDPLAMKFIGRLVRHAESAWTAIIELAAKKENG